MKDVIEIDHVSSFCAARAAQLFGEADRSVAIYIHVGYRQDGLFRRRGYTVYALDSFRCLPLGSYERSELGWCCVVRPEELTDPIEQMVKHHLNEWKRVADLGYEQETVRG